MWCVCWQCGVGLKGSVAPGLTHGCCWEWVLGHVSATDSMRCFPEPAATFMQSSKALGRCCCSLSCCMNPAWALVKLSREAFWGLFLPSSELLSLLIQNSFRSPGWWAWVGCWARAGCWLPWVLPAWEELSTRFWSRKCCQKFCLLWVLSNGYYVDELIFSNG